MDTDHNNRKEKRSSESRSLTALAAAVLAVLVAVSAIIPAAGAPVYAAAKQSSGTAAATRKAVTTITDYNTEVNKSIANSAIISGLITPANGGRTVWLQRYNSTTKKWRTIMRTKTADAPSAYVSFSIPRKSRKKTTSVWRIYVPETSSASARMSSNIKLTTRNLTKYNLSAKAACIYRINADGSGTFIYTDDASVKRAQASTTKLMTSILLLESGRINGKTRISAHAAATPWASGRLTKGDVYRNRDLLYAMLLPSSNDAATAVAESVGGSEKAFVRMMNAKASELELIDTQFMNPHGLDADGHYTTAVELAQLTAYAYTFPEIRKCLKTKSKTITSLKLKKSWTLWSTNAIFSYVRNFLGGKTGTESNAGCCFTGIYKSKGQLYVTVVLGSGYGFSRWADTQKLHYYIRRYAASTY